MALKTLNTLIRLHKRQIDLLRREMLILEDERRQLQELSGRLELEHEKEAQLAAESPDYGSFFEPYSLNVKNRRTQIAREVTRLDAEIEARLESIRNEFGEQKKFEIAREQMKKRMDAKDRQRLQQRFDEIGAQQYLRAKENP